MTPRITNRFVITCEHGGNRVPHAYRKLFKGQARLLKSHRGWDAGALDIAQDLAETLNAPLFASTVTRLLVDLNRSIEHSHIYSEATRGAPDSVRRELLTEHYLPYRNAVENLIAELIRREHRVIHISAHSFTPELKGKKRNADVGLLYDPGRDGEVIFCNHWHKAFKKLTPDLRVRRNYPYTGKADGFTTYLRTCFPPDSYLGIELEINQKHVKTGGKAWSALREQVAAAAASVIE